MRKIDLLNTAERLAPLPENRTDATREAWLRHYVAQALAAHVAFHAALPPVGAKPEPGSRPDLGYLIVLAVAATAAAIGLDTEPDQVAKRLWYLNPGCGGLNGEDVEWLTERADQLGINPADLDHRLDPGVFRSPSQIARDG